MFVKDYDTLKRVIDGRYLSLQEQIELEAEKSQDGCVYLQMIIPKYKTEEEIIDYENNNKTMDNDANSYLELRCKIFQINNYYNDSTFKEK